MISVFNKLTFSFLKTYQISIAHNTVSQWKVTACMLFDETLVLVSNMRHSVLQTAANQLLVKITEVQKYQKDPRDT